MAQKNVISKELKIAVVNYLNGRWEACDSGLLKSWLEESEDNSRLFGQLVDLWEADKMIRKEKEFDVDKAWEKLEVQLNPGQGILKRLPRFSRVWHYAAILVLVLFMGGLARSYLRIQSDNRLLSTNFVEYTVPYGSKTSMKLPDGSVVRLNAGTTIQYNQGYGIKDRDIVLSGEAFFEVAKNKHLPFIVNAKDISVQALGTKFNVKAYPEERAVETILLEGSVKLEYSGGILPQKVVMKPNQKVVFDSDGKNFAVSSINNTSEVSWITDKWVVKNMDLEDLAKLLERKYNVIITFNDDRIRNYEFGGTIKDETVEQVLTALTYSAPIKYNIKNKQVTLSIDESKVIQYNKLLNRK